MAQFPLIHDSCRQPQTYVKPEAEVTVFELLMMSGVSLKTCWAIKKHWNNKFYYTVASCLLLLYNLCYDILFHEHQDAGEVALRVPTSGSLPIPYSSSHTHLSFEYYEKHSGYINHFIFWCDSPHWARASSFTRFLDYTQRRTTFRRIPLDNWLAHRRDLYLTTYKS
jgi:hypothetical protein